MSRARRKAKATRSAKPRTGSVVRLVSMVRAGDYVLYQMLEEALGPNFGAVKSAADAGPGYRVIRSHDLLLDEPVRLSGTGLVVQTREPTGQIHAAAQRMRRVHGDRFPEANRDHVEFWAAGTLNHYRGFVEKWVKGAPPGAVVLSYDDMLEEPNKALEKVLKLFGPKLPRDRLNQIVARYAVGIIDKPSRLPVDLVEDFASAAIDPHSRNRIARIANALRASQDGRKTKDLLEAAKDIGNAGLLKALTVEASGS